MNGEVKHRKYWDDHDYMDEIAKIMSGNEWSADTLEAIAEVVRESGRGVTDIDEDEDDE